MADPVDERSDPVAGPEGEMTVAMHRRRFTVAFVALAVALAVLLVALGILAARSTPGAWTSNPIAGGIDDPVERAEAVAALVQQRYTAPDGAPRFRITAGEDVITDLPGRDQLVALASSATGAPWSFEQGMIVFYKLCGPAAGCAFAEPAGDARTKAFAIATRAAKELALRGLKNVPEAQSAIVILPTGIVEETPAPTVVNYYRRKDLERELDNGLPALYDEPVPDPASLSIEQAQTEIAPAAERLYRMNAKPGPDNAAMIYELTPAQ